MTSTYFYRATPEFYTLCFTALTTVTVNNDEPHSFTGNEMCFCFVCLFSSLNVWLPTHMPIQRTLAFSKRPEPYPEALDEPEERARQVAWRLCGRSMGGWSGDTCFLSGKHFFWQSSSGQSLLPLQPFSHCSFLQKVPGADTLKGWRNMVPMIPVELFVLNVILE